MAASFSNHSRLAPHISASFLYPSKDAELALLRVESLYPKPRFPKPIYGFSSSNLSFPMNSKHYIKRSTFKAKLSAQESAHTENVETSGGENLPGLKAMIRVYREALLNGDDRIVSEIESRISNLETEKNGLEKQVLELPAEIASRKEKFLHLQADFHNFRKRWEKEKLSTRSAAKREVVESLLPVVDSFERAKQQIKPETEKEKKIDSSYQGIYNQFVEIIIKNLQEFVIPTVEKPFDPSGEAESKDGLEVKSRDIDGLIFSAESKRKSENNNTLMFVLGVALVSVIVGVILGKRFSLRYQ